VEVRFLFKLWRWTADLDARFSHSGSIWTVFCTVGPLSNMHCGGAPPAPKSARHSLPALKSDTATSSFCLL